MLGTRPNARAVDRHTVTNPLLSQQMREIRRHVVR
jgi:hypothetical protein